MDNFEFYLLGVTLTLGVTVVAGVVTNPDVSDGVSWVRDVSASSTSAGNVVEAVVMVLES